MTKEGFGGKSQRLNGRRGGVQGDKVSLRFILSEVIILGCFFVLSWFG